MKISDVLNDDTKMSTWEEWVKHNVRDKNPESAWSRIKGWIAYNTLDLRYAPELARTLYGNDQPFVAPPGEFIKGGIEFSNYDFINTPTIRNLAVARVFLYSTNTYGDLPSLFRKFSNVNSLQRVIANIDADKVVNLMEACAEFEGSNVEIIIDITYRSNGSSIRGLGINLQRKFVNTTKGLTFEFSDSFELQDWLIENGFEDLV